MPKFDTVFPPSVEVPEVVINLPVAFTDTGDTGVVVPRPKEGEIEEDAGEVVSRTATYADATTKAMKNGQQQQQTNVAPQPLTSKPKQGKKRNMQLYESVPVQLDLISASKSEPQGDAESRIKEKERKRKKRKKGNAIDDIFGAFG